MYNKKVLIDSLKKLGSAKAPTVKRDMIIDPMGQWAHPGENTRIPSDRITMKGVNYPVLGVSNTGQKQMMQPGQEYTFPGADYVDEYPQLKGGGSTPKLPNKKNPRAYSRSLEATNRLFARHPWFAKPKSRKNKIYDPNSKYYAEGGEAGCPDGYAFNPITGECVEWTPTVWNSEDQPTSFDPIGDIIYMNPNDRPEGMSDEEYNQMYNDQLEHEQLHRLQWLNDDLKGQNKTPLRMPSTVDNQDYAGDHYYNRRQEEVDYLHDYWKKHHPGVSEFIPDEVIYNKETDPAMYELPWTVEGEARDYENATRSGMESFFPKRQFGGFGKDQSLSLSPYDLNTYIGASGNQIYNPAYSLTYNKPNLFKKLKVAGTPLEVSIGRPYNTDPNSLTNPSLNFGTSYGYEYVDPGVQQGPQQAAVNNAAAQYLGKNVQDLTQSDLNKFSAYKSLGEIKNAYAPGKPINVSTKLSFLGRSFNDQPVRGFASISGGYNPEAGFWAGADAGGFGLISNKKPKTYFDRGLTRKGDWAIIPKLSLFSPAIRQKGIANLEQAAEYKRLLEKDIQEGTQTAQKFYDTQLDSQNNPTATFNVRPEVKGEVKVGPGTLGGLIGANIDLLSGGKGAMDKISTNISPYGKISYAVSIQDQIDRAKRKMRNIEFPDKKHYEDYVEEYENEPTEETPTETDNEINPPQIELNPNGTVIGRGDCPEGYERPCEKCKCQKIKMPQMYTDKRGTHLFGNEPIRFQDGGKTPKDYQAFLDYSKTAPENRQPLPSYVYGDPNDYDHYGMWEALGKPKNFEEALQMNPDWQPDAYDGMYHGFSVNPETGVFLKSGKPGLKEGDTTWMEIAGHYLSPRANESTPVFDTDLQRFKYIPKEEDGGTIELKLTPEEIEEYKKGGYIIEDVVDDISIPKLNKFPGGGTPPGGALRLLSGLVNTGDKIGKLHIDDFSNLANIANYTKQYPITSPLLIEGSSGIMKLIPNQPENEWHLLADMHNPREAGKAFHMINQVLPPHPTLLETDSLSLDSLANILNTGRRKDWEVDYENDVPLNWMHKNSTLFKGLPTPTNMGFGLDNFTADKMVGRLNEFIKSKGFEDTAYSVSPPGVSNMARIYLPNYKLTRRWEEGGEIDYQLGDEVDEATMKKLKKLGYTFEKL